MVFITKNQVRMHDTDMAGRLYFAKQFRFVNDALEDFFHEEGIEMFTIFRQENFLIVIVHCEADYLAHLHVGDRLDIHVSCESIGTTSFTLYYQLFRKTTELVGTAKTVHVAIDSRTHKKIPLPQKLIDLLVQHRTPTAILGTP